MDLEVSPPLGATEHRALLVALERFVPPTSADRPYGEPWRIAGLREGAEGEDAEVRYAFSPRSTRGATRA